MNGPNPTHSRRGCLLATQRILRIRLWSWTSWTICKRIVSTVDGSHKLSSFPCTSTDDPSLPLEPWLMVAWFLQYIKCHRVRDSATTSLLTGWMNAGLSNNSQEILSSELARESEWMQAHQLWNYSMDGTRWWSKRKSKTSTSLEGSVGEWIGFTRYFQQAPNSQEMKRMVPVKKKKRNNDSIVFNSEPSQKPF